MDLHSLHDLTFLKHLVYGLKTVDPLFIFYKPDGLLKIRDQ